MGTRILQSLSVLLVALAFMSCTDEEFFELGPSGKADNRVYFIYMASDNNLHYSASLNQNAIKAGATRENIGEGRVFVFYDPEGSGPCQMLEFKRGDDLKGTKTVLRTYDEDMNTASPATLLRAIRDMKEFATKDGRIVDSYILDMWSHGNSWEYGTPAPLSLSTEGGVEIAPLAVANDGSHWMNLEAFAEAMEEVNTEHGPKFFDAIIFAECYGASVEMMYLLHDKTNYIIGSASEMPAYGVQYDRALPYIFKKTFDYESYCQSYYDYWSARDPLTATIAWFDCAEFTEDFIGIMKEIYASGEYSAAIGRFEAAAGVDAIGLQYYDANKTKLRKYYDLGDFVNAVYPGGGDIHGRFWEQYNKIVQFAIATPGIWSDYSYGHEIDLARFSGMTTYVMLNRNDGLNYTGKNNEYRQTAWYLDVYPQ